MTRMQAKTPSAAFEAWLEAMEIDPNEPYWWEKAGELLGRRRRTIEHYRNGAHLPDGVRLLMDAYMQGYRPSVAVGSEEHGPS